jgi:DNA-binding XRE family transcriptional regulator
VNEPVAMVAAAFNAPRRSGWLGLSESLEIRGLFQCIAFSSCGVITFCITPYRRNTSIPKVLVRQVKAARALLGWSQSKHAEHSGVSLPTIKRLEGGGRTGELGGLAETAEKLVSSLVDAGVIFMAENGEGHGVKIKKIDAAMSDHLNAGEAPRG